MTSEGSAGGSPSVDAGSLGSVFAGPHRRYDPLSDSWVLVSAGRDKRPWHGQVESPPSEDKPAYDPDCQLCPGNVRASGVRNPAYSGTFVFDNDFPALRPDTSLAGLDPSPSDTPAGALFIAEPEAGAARVLCFSPRHDRSLGSLPVPEIRQVIDLWATQTSELRSRYRWVQVFENRGPEMGASNPHPHGQLWAGTSLPSFAEREDVSQRRHYEQTGTPLLLDVVEREADGPRVVEVVEGWLALVPFWAAWPFELLLLPRRPVATLTGLDDPARDGLAELLSRLLRRIDGLFGRPFPYSMGWHQAPGRTAAGGLRSTGDRGTSTDALDKVTPDARSEGPAPTDEWAHWQLHAHLYPPLLRAEARKWMVGYELLAEPQRDFSPEEAAERLRAAAYAPAAVPVKAF